MTNEELKQAVNYDIKGISDDLKALEVRDADVAVPRTTLKEIEKIVKDSWETKGTQAGLDKLLEKAETLKDAIEGGIVFPLFDRDSDLSRDDLEGYVEDAAKIASALTNELTTNYLTAN